MDNLHAKDRQFLVDMGYKIQTEDLFEHIEAEDEVLKSLLMVCLLRSFKVDMFPKAVSVSDSKYIAKTTHYNVTYKVTSNVN